MLRLLEERAFPVDELRVYASPRSEGRQLPFAGGEVMCEVLRDGCFDGLDLVVIDVDDDLALEWAPRAAAGGARSSTTPPRSGWTPTSRSWSPR